MPIEPLIKEDRLPFSREHLRDHRTALDALSNVEREVYRNDNAAAIASHPSNRILIVSGPGTGKSTLFKQRINYWLDSNPSANILTLSFVRKLVTDLSNDIQRDTTLTAEQKERVDVYTLHKYTRSVVEQNHGTTKYRFAPHVKIITEFWKMPIWGDALVLAGVTNPTDFPLENFEKQLHNTEFSTVDGWPDVYAAYFRLSQFYNASGFADLILHATDILQENPDLIRHKFFIVDEYQDFNIAEDGLINKLIQESDGILIAGDDDQVLYEKLKSGTANLIRHRYTNDDFVNAMLPFCSRSDFHIAKVAEHFVLQNQETEYIEKVYLPLSTNTESEKVKIIACAKPSSAVDYVKKFLEDHHLDIEQRRIDIQNGVKKDPYLLILTPQKDVGFYHDDKDELFEAIKPYIDQSKTYPPDYYLLLSYYSLANHPENNFTFRKVLYYEGLSSTEVVALIRVCFNTTPRLCDLSNDCVRIAIEKANLVKTILDSRDSIDEKLRRLSSIITIDDADSLRPYLPTPEAADSETSVMERTEEEEEISVFDQGPLSSVELMGIIGSKGLSADHVIILGFDNVNMPWITRNAFYVAMTRARKSLHLITALGSRGAQQANQFLVYLPDSHLEFSVYKKTGREMEVLNSRNEFINKIRTWGRFRLGR